MSLITFLRLLLLGLVIAALALFIDYRTFLQQPLNIPSAGAELTVKSGDSIKALTQRLEQGGLIDSAFYLQFYTRLSKQDTNIKAGNYHIESGAKPAELIALLVSGRVVQERITIIEGWSFKQMLQALAEQPKLSHTLLGVADAEIMRQLGHPDEHPEGRFFPDTYLYAAGTTDLEILRQAYQAMSEQLAQAWQQRAPDLPLNNAYDALILASIIEKETGLASERETIAGVFIRRLQKNMRLQTDPTVIYGLGDAFDGNIRRRDLITDTPYNTYMREGLPPTPIALPGKEALLAAVQPAAGDALYFVAKGDGGHVFSRSLSEHNRAVRKYQLRKNN